MSTTSSSPENVPTRLAHCRTDDSIYRAAERLYLPGLNPKTSAEYSGLIIRQCVVDNPETILPGRNKSGSRTIAYGDIQDGQSTALETLQAAIIHELGIRGGPQLPDFSDWHSQTQLLDRVGAPKQLESGELVRLYTPFSGSILQVIGLEMNTEAIKAALENHRLPVIMPGDVVAFSGPHRIRTAHISPGAETSKGALRGSIRIASREGSIHEQPSAYPNMRRGTRGSAPYILRRPHK